MPDARLARTRETLPDGYQFGQGTSVATSGVMRWPDRPTDGDRDVVVTVASWLPPLEPDDDHLWGV